MAGTIQTGMEERLKELIVAVHQLKTILEDEIAFLDWQLDSRGKWTILLPDRLAKWIWRKMEAK